MKDPILIPRFLFVPLVFLSLVASADSGAKFEGSKHQLRGPLATEYLLRAGQVAGQNLIKIGPGNQTSWIKSFPDEPEQSFKEFVKEAEKAPRDPAATIYILPMKKFEGEKAAAMKKTAEFLSIFYGANVEILDPIEASGLKTNGKGQLNASPLIDDYIPRRIPQSVASKALGIVAITDTDLYYKDARDSMNFVFGYTSAKFPVIGWSFNRFGNSEGTGAEKKLFTERSLKISAHELGHLNGLPHTKTHRCIMNGYNNLEDLDSSPLEMCPVDASKTWYDRKLDPVAYYKSLIAWATQNNVLENEVKIWQKNIENIEKQANSPVEPLKRTPPSRTR